MLNTRFWRKFEKGIPIYFSYMKIDTAALSLSLVKSFSFFELCLAKNLEILFVPLPINWSFLASLYTHKKNGSCLCNQNRPLPMWPEIGLLVCAFCLPFLAFVCASISVTVSLQFDDTFVVLDWFSKPKYKENSLFFNSSF